jgi:DNA-binding CsgD family transcriptional regulator
MTIVICCVEPMARLSPSDLGQALNFLREAEGVTGHDPFPSELLDLLRELVGCDYVNYCELDRPHERVLFYDGCSRAREVDAGVGEDAVRTFWRLRHQHPVCVHQDLTQDFAALKVSDFLTRRQLRRREIYWEFFRPFGVEFELDVGLPAPPTDTKVFLFESGSRDFTERERLLLDLLRPHFVSLYAAARNRRVLAALEGREESARSLVVLGSNGGVDFVGPDALELLHRYFETDRDRLPDVVSEWLREESARLNGDGALRHPPRPLAVKHDDRRLVVQRVDDVLLLREEAATLTRREREILALVAEGRSNAEIAAKLWLSAGTVRIHLQHIYEKLGVRNRTAAVAHVRDMGRPRRRRRAVTR